MNGRLFTRAVETRVRVKIVRYFFNPFAVKSKSFSKSKYNKKIFNILSDNCNFFFFFQYLYSKCSAQIFSIKRCAIPIYVIVVD